MINRDELLTEMKEEQRLRKVVRRLLEGYLREKEEKRFLEEQRLRKVVSTLIKESLSADVADEQPQRSTGINALRKLLKNIVPTIEDAYKELTTSKEQRDSFRAHILNAMENALKPIENLADAGMDTLEEDIELEEEAVVRIEKEDESKFIPVRPEDEEEEVEEEAEEKINSFQDIQGMDVTGRNFAATTFNQIENQTLDAYENIADSPVDREEFEDYLLTNLKLYFDRFEEELQPTVEEPESPGYDDKKDLDIEAAKKLAIKAVTSAIRRDVFTGEGIDIVVIDKSGYKKVDYKKFKDVLRDE